MTSSHIEKNIFRKLKPFFFLLSLVFLGGLIWFYIHNLYVNNNTPQKLNIGNIELPFCTQIGTDDLQEPSGLGIDIENKVLWTVCDNTRNVVKMDYCGNILGLFRVETSQTTEDKEEFIIQMGIYILLLKIIIAMQMKML